MHAKTLVVLTVLSMGCVTTSARQWHGIYRYPEATLKIDGQWWAEPCTSSRQFGNTMDTFKVPSLEENEGGMVTIEEKVVTDGQTGCTTHQIERQELVLRTDAHDPASESEIASDGDQREFDGSMMIRLTIGKLGAITQMVYLLNGGDVAAGSTIKGLICENKGELADYLKMYKVGLQAIRGLSTPYGNGKWYLRYDRARDAAKALGAYLRIKNGCPNPGDSEAVSVAETLLPQILAAKP